MGNVAAVRAEVGEYMPGFHAYEDYRGTYPARAELGGGVVLCQIHEYDLLYALFGLPHEVFAVGGQTSKLAAGCRGHRRARCSATAKPGRADMPAQVHQDFLQQPPRRNFQIIGDEGNDLLGLSGQDAPIIWRQRCGGGIGKLCHICRATICFISEMKHFLACVAGRETPRVSLRDGAQSLRMALAVKQSIASGKVVQL